MNEQEIMRYLIDNIPMILDIEKQDLKHDSRNINYKIYKYIKGLQKEIQELKQQLGKDQKSA